MTNGGMDQQVIRGKLLWNASDNVHGDFRGGLPASGPAFDRRHHAAACSRRPAVIFGFLYNFCISNPAVGAQPITPNDPRVIAAIPASRSSGVDAVFNTTTGVCGPRAVVPRPQHGAPPLAGAGYVTGPAATCIIPGGTPRILLELRQHAAPATSTRPTRTA